MSVSLQDQVAIVTGGGRNLGRSYCLEFARLGAAVVVNDVSTEHADEVVAEIAAAGGRAVACYESVATQAGGAALTELALAQFGTVDILVNNAGNMSNNRFEDLTIEQLDAVFAVHVRGAFFVTQPAWRVMKEKGYGRIVIASSAAGMYARQGSANYSTAKAGLYGFAKALTYEGADYGIKVNVLLPRSGGGGGDGQSSAMLEGTPIAGMAEAADRYAPGHREVLGPRRRPGGRIAPLVAYLVSPDCEVSGEAFSAGWGWYGRVFVGVSGGGAAPDVDAIDVDDIDEHFEEIRNLDRYGVPRHNYDETRWMMESVAAAQSATAAG